MPLKWKCDIWYCLMAYIYDRYANAMCYLRCLMLFIKRIFSQFMHKTLQWRNEDISCSCLAFWIRSPRTQIAKIIPSIESNMKCDLNRPNRLTNRKSFRNSNRFEHYLCCLKWCWINLCAECVDMSHQIQFYLKTHTKHITHFDFDNNQFTLFMQLMQLNGFRWRWSCSTHTHPRSHLVSQITVLNSPHICVRELILSK